MFDLSGLSGKTIKIRVGDPLKLDIPFSGAPTPTVDWLKAGRKLDSQPRCQIETKNSTASLFIPAAKRDDSGDYQLKAKNEHGDTKADFTVIVVDRPGPPKGPVTFTGVQVDTVTLNWSPPSDDGGGEITSKPLSQNII